MDPTRISAPQPPSPTTSVLADLKEDPEHSSNSNGINNANVVLIPPPLVLTVQEPSPISKPETESTRKATAIAYQASSLTTPRNPGAFLPSPKLKTPGYLNLDNYRPRSPLSKSISVQDTDDSGDYFGNAVHVPIPSAIMSRRKLWVQRPNASATLVKIEEDDLVDEVRDLIITKYANSLGRTFDAPDVTLRIIPRERSQQMTERTLGPDESMVRALEMYFPGGQLMEEALLIDMPQSQRKITPRHSPHIVTHMPLYEDSRPVEHGTEYFPPMALMSPNIPQSSGPHASHDHRPSLHGNTHPHSMAILETGQLPPLPSPSMRSRKQRPQVSRQMTSPTQNGYNSHTSANTTNHTSRNRPRVGSTGESRHSSVGVPPPPPLPTPPATAKSMETIITKPATPPVNRASSPQQAKVKKGKKVPATEQTQDRTPNVYLQAGLLDGSVPPINILIVEDNKINLRLLEKFVMKLRVRWDTAENGEVAVTKWRGGGFHLVLMDIQMPIMNGLEATKEMRRLERVNGIGVFAKGEEENGLSISKLKGHVNGDAMDVDLTAEGVNNDDKLTGSFKSPVIIVALTASSLQSDRHEALAAGCNDFLTKPVDKVWLERKIMEWGCMQALIDFDGWRQWKAYSASTDGADGPDAKSKGKKKDRIAAAS